MTFKLSSRDLVQMVLVQTVEIAEGAYAENMGVFQERFDLALRLSDLRT